MSKLDTYRKELDRIDGRIIFWIKKRMCVCKSVGDYKKRYGIETYNRLEKIRRKKMYSVLGESGEFVYENLHWESLKKQK